MALTAPRGETDLIPVVFFPNAGKGCFYAVTKRGENNTLPEGYDRTINMTVGDGRISPSFAYNLQQNVASKAPPAFLIPWTDSNDRPIVISGAGNYIRTFANGGFAVETDATPDIAFSAAVTDGGNVKVTVPSSSSFAVNDAVIVTGASVTAYNGTWTVTAVAVGFVSFNAVFSATATGTISRSAEYASAALWDDGGGTALLYAGTKTGRKLISKRTRAGVWTELSDTADHKGIFLAVGGGRLWATANDYQIKNWSAGSDPNAGTPSALIQVGSNTAKITSLGMIGGSPVVGKEDGIWIYNSPSDLFEPAFPAAFNPDNFRFMESDGAGGLFTSLASGALVRIQRFGKIDRIDPHSQKPVDRDTPRGRFTHVIPYQDGLLAIMDGGWRATQSIAGLTILLATGITGGADLSGTGAGGNFTTSGTFTDYTELLTDGRADTVLDLSAFDTIANGHALWIGADQKFIMSDWKVVGANTANIRFRFGILTTNTVVTDLRPLFNGTDSTPFSTSTPLAQSGRIGANHSAQTIGPPSSAWVARSVNSTSKFWMMVYTV